MTNLPTVALTEPQRRLLTELSPTHSYEEVVKLIKAKPSLTVSAMYEQARALRRMKEKPFDETLGTLQNNRAVVQDDLLLNVRQGVENLARYLANVDVQKLSLRDTRDYLANLQGVLSTWERIPQKGKRVEGKPGEERGLVQHLAQETLCFPCTKKHNRGS